MMQPAALNLHLKPMLHVEQLDESINFYCALSSEVHIRSRDGDWALVRCGDTSRSLLARPPGPRHEDLELQLECQLSFEDVQRQFKEKLPSHIEREVGDEVFGRMMRLHSPSGRRIKIRERTRPITE